MCQSAIHTGAVGPKRGVPIGCADLFILAKILLIAFFLRVGGSFLRTSEQISVCEQTSLLCRRRHADAVVRPCRGIGPVRCFGHWSPSLRIEDLVPVGLDCADEQQVLLVSSSLGVLDKVLARSFAHRCLCREEYQLHLHIKHHSRAQLMVDLSMCGSQNSDVLYC